LLFLVTGRLTNQTCVLEVIGAFALKKSVNQRQRQ